MAAAAIALATPGADLSVVARSDMPMCVVDARDPEQPIVFANDAFVALSGYAAEEIIGRNCRFMQGPDSKPADIAQFRAGLASGRPFQVAIVNHTKAGEPYRNEVFVSPVRDAAGEITLFLGMQVPIAAPVEHSAAVAAMRHQFRNKIQTMTSLVALMGQRLPAGEGRDAFVELRARFEALTIDYDGEPSAVPPPGGVLERLAERVIGLFDPSRTSKIAISVDPLTVTPRLAALYGQVLTELVIDLFRNGFSRGAPVGEVSVTLAADGEVRIRVSAPEGEAAASVSGDLGQAIANSIARSLGGRVERETGGAFEAVAILPAPEAR